MIQNKPGIEERPIQQRPVVVIADKVRHLHLSGAGLWCVVGVGLHAIVRAPHVEQQDVKVQDGVRRDDVTWRETRQGVNTRLNQKLNRKSINKRLISININNVCDNHNLHTSTLKVRTSFNP